MVKRANQDGSSVEVLAGPMSSMRPFLLTLHGGFVYFSDTGEDRVARVPIGGGTVETMGTSSKPYGVAVTDEWVYWYERRVTWRVAYTECRTPRVPAEGTPRKPLQVTRTLRLESLWTMTMSTGLRVRIGSTRTGHCATVRFRAARVDSRSRWMRTFPTQSTSWPMRMRSTTRSMASTVMWTERFARWRNPDETACTFVGRTSQPRPGCGAPWPIDASIEVPTRTKPSFCSWMRSASAWGFVPSPYPPTEATSLQAPALAFDELPLWGRRFDEADDSGLLSQSVATWRLQVGDDQLVVTSLGRKMAADLGAGVRRILTRG